MRHNLAWFREQTLTHLLFSPTDLKGAIDRLGFVQADPIRSPAPAQDLILRQRVLDYRCDDLTRSYASLDLEEGVLYAYGFMPRLTWLLLRPRSPVRLSSIEERVLDIIREKGRVQPRDLDEKLGRLRVRGDWGGQATAGKHALEALHRRRLVRVAGRENGLRAYELATVVADAASPIERLRHLALIVATSMGPVPMRSLQSTLAPIGRALVAVGAGLSVVQDLLRTGELAVGKLGETTYVWRPRTGSAIPMDQVRILAPFDPLVRDRMRFEQLWGWTYRFEAYTPRDSRVRGYYAMPVLWRDAVIGWANATRIGETLDLKIGYVRTRPREKAYTAALDAEVVRLRRFLRCNAGRLPRPSRTRR